MAILPKKVREQKARISKAERDAKKDKKLWIGLKKIHKRDESFLAKLKRLLSKKPKKRGA
jgi:hypothetical protein